MSLTPGALTRRDLQSEATRTLNRDPRSMTDFDDLKELFRAEIGIVHAEVRALRDDTRDLKAAVNRFQATCNGRHGDLATRVTRLENDHAALNRERKLILGGLAVALTGAVKAFFDWLTK